MNLLQRFQSWWNGPKPAAQAQEPKGVAGSTGAPMPKHITPMTPEERAPIIVEARREPPFPIVYVPDFPPLVNTAERQHLFGKFTYRSAPIAGNPERITVTNNWRKENIVWVPIPQLHAVKGAEYRDGNWGMDFHRAGAAQLVDLWHAWETAGLLDLVLTFEGSYVPRFIRGSRKTLSNHAFGTAFDINYFWNQLGKEPALAGNKGSVHELVPLASAYGFFWGGHYSSRKDGMHFELAMVL